MSRFINIEFVDWGSMKEHLFGDKNVGNCVLCGEFLGLDLHHKVTQSKGGGKEDEVNVCRKCHNWIHNNPAEARARGLYFKEYKL